MLRTRLFLHLLPLVVILLATGWYATVLFSRMAETVDRRVTKEYRSLVAVQEMNLALTALERDTWSAVASDTAVSRKAMADNARRFEEQLERLIRNGSLDRERALSQALAAEYEDFRRAAASLRSVPKAEERNTAYAERIPPKILRMESRLNEILELNQGAILATGKRVQEINGEVRRLMIMGLAIGLAISACASYLLGRWVLQPLRRLTAATMDLAEGNLSPIVPVASQDELGQLARVFNQMAQRLQEYRQSTTEQIVRLHRTLETTVGSFPDPIFVLNRDGVIEVSNPAANELAASLKLDGRLPPPLAKAAQEALASGQNFLPHSFNQVIPYRLNGGEKFFLPRILTMRDKEGTLFGVAVVLYDVTRFRLLDAAKTHLVGTVSHELKTPLTSLRMALHLLLERSQGELSPKQEELLQTAREDAERLLRTLNNLLDLACLEEGGAGLHRERVAPGELLQQAMLRTTDRVTAEGLHLDCALEPDLPSVSVDRERIHHVFANFILNAAKHSPAGGHIRLQAAKTDSSCVQFTVSDDGPGIAREYHGRIFERFFRVPGQHKTGAGLGLSIAREIAVSHGGRVGVRSAPGKGATFFLILEAAPKPA